MIDGAPKDVLEAASLLSCSELVIVNLVVNRPELIDAHWTYFYDRDDFFTRLSTPHLQSPNNVPPGCGSLQAECYYSKKYRPRDVTPEQCMEPVIHDLKKEGILREGEEEQFNHTMYVHYASAIFDLDHAKARETVHGF